MRPHPALSSQEKVAIERDQLLWPKDTELRAVLDAFFIGTVGNEYGKYISGSALEKEIQATPVSIEFKKPCYSSDGNETDAATATTLAAPICFSARRLSQVPKQALKDQLQALFIHEISHHFGFNEKSAVKIQKYFLDEILTKRAQFRVALRRDRAAIARGVINNLRSGKTDGPYKGSPTEQLGAA